MCSGSWHMDRDRIDCGLPVPSEEDVYAQYLGRGTQLSHLATAGLHSLLHPHQSTLTGRRYDYRLSGNHKQMALCRVHPSHWNGRLWRLLGQAVCGMTVLTYSVLIT